MKRLTSRHHPLVALCRSLAKGGAETRDHMLLDGPHLVVEACKSGVAVESAALSDSFLAGPEGTALAASLQRAGVELLNVTESLIDAMSPVASPAGIVAIARRPERALSSVLGHPPQLVIVAVDVQDPGNVGAMARAAEAAGATGLVLCGSSADPFSWKALRGSMGSLLRLPTVQGLAWVEAVAAARSAGLQVLATVPSAGTILYELNLRGPVAFLLGGEGPGLPDEAVRDADAHISIPMRAPVESLNVSVAAGVLLYEAARQRATGAREGAASSPGS